MYHPHDIRKRTHEADQKAIEEYLARGGEIAELVPDVDNTYERNQEKNKKLFGNGINPFSKTDALKVRKTRA